MSEKRKPADPVKWLVHYLTHYGERETLEEAIFGRGEDRGLSREEMNETIDQAIDAGLIESTIVEVPLEMQGISDRHRYGGRTRYYAALRLAKGKRR